MKKLSKLVVKDQAEALHEDEMKLILGGGTYKCFCGASGSGNSFYTTASTLDDALFGLSYACRPYGIGGCFMS